MEKGHVGDQRHDSFMEAINMQVGVRVSHGIPRRKKKKKKKKKNFNMKKRHLVLRRCEPGSRNPSDACTRRRSIRYGECQKNHAASVGGYAVDGCREFMADGEEGTSDALKCAACGCHRSFHRRVQEYEGSCDCSFLTMTRQ